MIQPRVLCVDLVGDQGHANIDRLFLAAMRPRFEVSFLAIPAYLVHFEDEPIRLIPLPEGLHLKGKGKVLHRFNQVLRWRALKQELARTRYDAVVIFNYEVVTASLLAPGQGYFWSIEHNVIDQTRRSGFKMACFRRLPGSWGHFVFFDYIGEFVGATTGRRTATLPHPLYGDRRENIPPPEGFPAGKKVIFAPSGSNDRQVVARTKSFLAGNPELVLAVRGPATDSAGGIISRPRFDDYAAWIQNAWAVFFCGDFRYRASGVIYDALTLGTPVIVHDCLLGRKMHELYPHAVRVIEHPSEIVEMEMDALAVQEDCRKFLAAHSPSALSQVFAETLGLNPR